MCPTTRPRSLRTLLLGACLAVSGAVPGAGDHAGTHGHGDRGAIGEPGQARHVSRTIDVDMRDIYFEPQSITVAAGETIRFRVVNHGALVHEFNIGTASMHVAHQREMLEMMEQGALHPTRIDAHGKPGSGYAMAHDDPNSVLLEPGERGEIIWRFADAGGVEFACNVPAHYEAGMVGEIVIE